MGCGWPQCCAFLFGFTTCNLKDDCFICVFDSISKTISLGEHIPQKEHCCYYLVTTKTSKSVYPVVTATICSVGNLCMTISRSICLQDIYQNGQSPELSSFLILLSKSKLSGYVRESGDGVH